MTRVEPSCRGEVSITDRGCPLLRPVVVSRMTGMADAFHPSRPPLTVRITRWTAFMVFKARSLGMCRT